MSDRLQRFTLWLLRRFKVFRDREDRILILEHRLHAIWTAQAGIIVAPSGTTRRLESELSLAANLALPLGITVEVLPTVQDAELGPGQIQVRIFEGASRG